MVTSNSVDCYDVVIVGGGAAGVGVSIALMHAGIENFIVLERDRVGASFAAWPAETRFITPSFPSNFDWHARFEFDCNWSLARIQYQR